MKNKKGFTLVELLAVIAILGVILLLIVPNIVKMFNEGKKDAFVRQVQSLIRTAEKEYEANLTVDKDIRAYCDSSFSSYGCAELSLNSTDVKYLIAFDERGKLRAIGVQDKNYCYLSTDASIDIDKEDLVKKGTLTCDNKGCTCSESSTNTGNDNPVDDHVATDKDGYVYWTQTTSGERDYSYYPSITFDSPSDLSDGFVRTKLDSNDEVVSQELCYKNSVGTLCFSNVIEASQYETFIGMFASTYNVVPEEVCEWKSASVAECKPDQDSLLRYDSENNSVSIRYGLSSSITLSNSGLEFSNK